MTLFFDATTRPPRPRRDGGDFSGLTRLPTEQERIVVAAKKTVDIFAGITQRRLFLKNEKGTPHTDGHSVVVDFSSDTLYQDVEHELFHVLFGSDPLAKTKFVEQYTNLVGKAAAAQKIELKKAALVNTVEFLIGLLEDRRVNSLGSLFYPGATALLKKQDRDLVLPHSPHAHKSFLIYFACIETGIELEEGPLDQFRPLFEMAISKVERRGFAATLVTAKWLVTRLVDEIIAATAGKSKKSSKESLPSPGASGQERSEALSDLISMAGVPPELSAHFSDVTSPELAPSREDAERAKQMVAEALKANVNDEGAFEQLLDVSEKEMAVVVERAQEALRPSLSPDDWLRKDAAAKVVFQDVTEQDMLKAERAELTSKDEEAIKRLRALFIRVMGRRRAALEDFGAEVDVDAYIERITTRQPVPVFQHEVSGRGFRALLLCDLSSSMQGEKIRQVARATTITNQALKFPSVRNETWGFRSPDPGEVAIVRFPGSGEFVITEKSDAEGATPLHIAIKVAGRHLDQGTEVKQLFILTDGHPTYSRRDGTDLGKAQLMVNVRKEVLSLRARGINVTCVLIGADLPERALGFMFGHEKHWRRLDEQTFGNGLVKLITSSFLDYLRHG